MLRRRSTQQLVELPESRYLKQGSIRVSDALLSDGQRAELDAVVRRGLRAAGYEKPPRERNEELFQRISYAQVRRRAARAAPYEFAGIRLSTQPGAIGPNELVRLRVGCNGGVALRVSALQPRGRHPAAGGHTAE